MVTRDKPPVLVVLQLTGGNDYMNTVIPYTDPNYYDGRTTLGIDQESVLKIDDELGFHPNMGPVKEIYDRGDMAVIHGVGYANSPRSHFRSMDIWHTCEPDIIGTEGWVGRAIRDLDPGGENPVTGVNIGQGLPRAMLAPGVSVASVADLSTYGLLTSIGQQGRREKMLTRFVNMYGQAIGTGPVQDYLGQTGLDALKGADILKDGLGRYSSPVEYADDPIAKSLRDIAMIHTADVGTRVFYCQHGSFDTHASQAPTFDKLWTEVSGAIADFWDDLREHDDDDNVVMFLFSEFGRRVRDGLPTIEVPRARLEEGVPIYDLMREAGLVRSNSEARRLIRGGGARVNDEPVRDETGTVGPDDLTAEGAIKLSAGRKRHALVRPA